MWSWPVEWLKRAYCFQLTKTARLLGLLRQYSSAVTLRWKLQIKLAVIPITVYWCRTNQYKHWPHKAKSMTTQPLECDVSKSQEWINLRLNPGLLAFTRNASPLDLLGRCWVQSHPLGFVMKTFWLNLNLQVAVVNTKTYSSFENVDVNSICYWQIGWKANCHFLQNALKQSSVCLVHFSPHTYTAHVEWWV